MVRLAHRHSAYDFLIECSNSLIDSNAGILSQKRRGRNAQLDDRECKDYERKPLQYTCNKKGLDSEFSEIILQETMIDPVMCGDIIVNPETQRKNIMKILYEGNFSVSRMKLIIYSKLPRLEIDLCEAPTDPWRRIHIDCEINFMEFHCLIVVDAYSKFVSIYKAMLIFTHYTIRFVEED
ncbi:hypothetical protein RF11_04757 [Thelohanellus kitauei]|uniref:Integrase catalytic domain-containing protein n=1 Tax=Thelohanellus kitauei TaxID=669202 RepID=A0A0C2MR49_THEKT|nr:hypothetical protein RF11_04757 [Thelohanellus kitauei]